MPDMGQHRQDARDLLEKSTKLLIVPHANVDPDGLSSALSCYKLFTALGKQCMVVCPDTLPESLSFMPGFDELNEGLSVQRDFIITLKMKEGIEVDGLNYAVEQDKVNIIVTPKGGSFLKEDVAFEQGAFPFDLLVVVDSANLALLGSVHAANTALFEQIPILNIDHHISNDQFGSVNMIDTECASATEVLYEWFESVEDWKKYIDRDMATLLLTGIITDTRSFQNPNTTPKSLEVAADLIDLGANQQEIIKQIYKTKPLSTLKIWGRALHNLQVNAEERIAWSTISKDELNEMQSESKETHGIIDELLTTIPDMDVCILFTEVEDGGFKASARSSETIDISAIAHTLYGGGGHARAAGFRIKEYPNFQLAALECVQKIIEELKKQRSQTSSVPPHAPDQDIVQVPEQSPTPVPQPVQPIDVVQEISDKNN